MVHVLPNGYQVLRPRHDTTPWIPPSYHRSDQVGGITVLNTGGTATALPSQKVTGVTSRLGVFGSEGPLGPLVKQLGMGALDLQWVKGSEDYTLQDYKLVYKILRDHPRCRKWIIVHGTDNMGFFAPWVALIARQLNLKVLLTCSQRSLDRPTCQLVHLLTLARSLINRVKAGRSYVLSGYHPRIHSPLQIRKTHTSSKDCFYSQSMALVGPNMRFPRYDLPVVDLQVIEPRQVSIGYPLPWNHLVQCQVILSYGLGNRPPNSRGVMFTRIPAGPCNPLLYGGHQRAHSMSPEAYTLLRSVA